VIFYIDVIKKNIKCLEHDFFIYFDNKIFKLFLNTVDSNVLGQLKHMNNLNQKFIRLYLILLLVRPIGSSRVYYNVKSSLKMYVIIYRRATIFFDPIYLYVISDS
jgi:hypothetical protein